MKSRIIVYVACIMSILGCIAQPIGAQPRTWPINEVLNRTSTDTVPFYATKTTRTPSGKGYGGIVNPNNSIPDKLYDDVQLTQYVHASISPELTATFFRKFAIPNSNSLLMALIFGNNYGGYETVVLCSVTPVGTLLDTLEVAVKGVDVHVKQFRINAQTQIIVSSITSTSATPLVLFESFTTFTGQRTDRTYTVNTQGQFVETSVQHFQPRTYARSYLENTGINIWEGNETPL